MLSTSYQESMVEVLAILNASPRDEVNKIPKKLLDFFNKNASTTYNFYYDKNIDLKDVPLKKETKGLLCMLYRNYLSTPEERANFDKILQENQRKFEEEQREKYNPDNLFKNNNVNANNIASANSNANVNINNNINSNINNNSNNINNNNNINTITNINTSSGPVNENEQISVYKENFFTRFINKIKNIFKR